MSEGRKTWTSKEMTNKIHKMDFRGLEFWSWVWKTNWITNYDRWNSLEFYFKKYTFQSKFRIHRSSCSLARRMLNIKWMLAKCDKRTWLHYIRFYLVSSVANKMQFWSTNTDHSLKFDILECRIWNTSLYPKTCHHRCFHASNWILRWI